MTDHHGPGLNDKKLAFTDRLMLRHIDGLTAVTEALRMRSMRLLSLPEERCIFAVNGIEIPPKHAPWTGRPAVVQIANLQRPKGHVTALRAAAIIRRRIGDLKWTCVGRLSDPPTEYLRQVRALIKDLDLTDCVTLTGLLTDIGPQLRQAHVGVLTSDSEGLPLSILEYMAAQLPVVMTDVGQGPAILKAAEAGTTAPPGDAETFAERVLELLTDSGGRRRKLGENGRDCVIKHYSIEAMAEQVHQLYTLLLASRN